MLFAAYIYILTNVTENKFIGDRNQALGIQTALRQLLQNHFQQSQNDIQGKVQENDQKKDSRFEIFSQEFDVNNIDKLEKQISDVLLQKKQHKQIVIGVGEHGLKVLPKLKEKYKDEIITVWSSHQMIKGLTEDGILDQLDIVALPQYAIKPSDEKLFLGKKAQLVKTIGVAHNVTKDSMKTEFETWSSQEKNSDVVQQLEKHNNIMGVFLGGDAPSSNGEMHYFTQENALFFAKLLAQKAKEKDMYVLVTNSPRTGKYNPKNKKEQNVHKKGSAIDETTQAFLIVLDKYEVNYYFENFESFENVTKSAYKPFLGALAAKQDKKIEMLKKEKNTGNDNGLVVAFVTGDSTSMISEITDNLEPGSVSILQVDSMNETHIAHVDSCVNSNIANKITLDGQGLGEFFKNLQIRKEVQISSEEKIIEPNSNSNQLSFDAKIIAEKTIALFIQPMLKLHGQWKMQELEKEQEKRQWQVNEHKVREQKEIIFEIGKYNTILYNYDLKTSVPVQQVISPNIAIDNVEIDTSEKGKMQNAKIKSLPILNQQLVTQIVSNSDIGDVKKQTQQIPKNQY